MLYEPCMIKTFHTTSTDMVLYLEFRTKEHYGLLHIVPTHIVITLSRIYNQRDYGLLYTVSLAYYFEMT